MLYLALGFAVLALAAWGFRGSRAHRMLSRYQWRILIGVLSVAAFAGAAFVSVRGGWGTGVVLFVLGLWMANAVRTPRIGPRARAGPSSEVQSLAEARAILGVSADATRDDVEEAYKRLMRRAHPDQGGTTGLASQLNAARDRLLRNS